MCDTLVAINSETSDKTVIFAKNSDRDPNEVQNLVHIPRRQNDSDILKTTYVEIPQVKETNEVFLSKPFWMWGAEMGVSEQNVVIGNEAVYSKAPLEKQALLGMDLLRLALERSKTAQEAVSVITSLLEQFGQGGECGYTRHATYHNSFIIADPKEAFVLETAGRYWITEKVKSIRTISNCLTIGSDYTAIHPGLIDYAINKGYCKDDKDFHFANNFNAKFMTWAAKGNQRRSCTLNELSKNKGKLTVDHFMNALRSHNTDKVFNPAKSSMAMPCVHASSFQTPSQSTGSQVSKISSDKTINWFTGTSGPCTSIFKPFILGHGEYSLKSLEGDKIANSNSLWWKHEKVHRLILKNYKLMDLIREERNKREEEWIKAVESNSYSKDQLFDQTKRILTEGLELEDKYYSIISEHYKKEKGLSFNPYTIKYNRYWNKWNKKANLEL
jgi:dipeptidase